MAGKNNALGNVRYGIGDIIYNAWYAICLVRGYLVVSVYCRKRGVDQIFGRMTIAFIKFDKIFNKSNISINMKTFHKEIIINIIISQPLGGSFSYV